MNYMQNSGIFKINKLLTYLIVIWICCPLVAQKTGMITGAFLSILWVITVMLLRNGSLVISRITVCILLFGAYLGLSYIINGKVYGNFDPVTFIAYVSLFFISYFIFDFYSKNEPGVLKSIFYLCLICLSIGCIISIKYSNMFPGIMKGIDSETSLLADGYRKVGIGAFGFVYLTLVTVLACINSIFKLKCVRHILLYLLFIVLGTYTIIVSTYTNAIILLIFGTVFILMLRRVKEISPMVFISMLLIIIIFLVIKAELGVFLSSLNLESEGVNTRLHEIGMYLQYGERGYNLGGRLDLLDQSFRCFKENFLLGYNFASNSTINPGGHAQIIDTFAIYGIIGGSILYTLFFLMLKKVFVFEHEYGNNYRFALAIVLFTYSFLNPLIYIFQVGFAVFLIPACSVMASSRVNENEIIKSS